MYTSLYASTHKAGLPTPLLPTKSGAKTAPPPTDLSKNVLTLAEILKRRGFKTACFHDNHFASAKFHMDQGFESIHQQNGR